MNEKAQAMLLASFVGDALSLGVHWIYNTNVIDKKWGPVENYIKPERPTYHPTKDIGELTHYGDQTMVLLESIAEKECFDLQEFSRRCQLLFSGYDGYYDQATKTTLSRYRDGNTWEDPGSPSNDA